MSVLLGYGSQIGLDKPSFWFSIYSQENAAMILSEAKPLTLKQAAKYLNLSEHELIEIASAGHLPASQFGNHIWFNLSDIHSFLSSIKHENILPTKVFKLEFQKPRKETKRELVERLKREILRDWDSVVGRMRKVR